MTIAQAFCTSAKLKFLQGEFLSTDVYKIALYSASASMDANTSVYSNANEVSNGLGYTTGGLTLVGYSVTMDSGEAYLDWTINPSWPDASFTARGALIYDFTHTQKASIAVLDFNQDYIATNDTFTVVLPVPASGSAIMRIT